MLVPILDLLEIKNAATYDDVACTLNRIEKRAPNQPSAREVQTESDSVHHITPWKVER